MVEEAFVHTVRGGTPDEVGYARREATRLGLAV